MVGVTSLSMPYEVRYRSRWARANSGYRAQLRPLWRSLAEALAERASRPHEQRAVILVIPELLFAAADPGGQRGVIVSPPSTRLPVSLSKKGPHSKLGATQV